MKTKSNVSYLTIATKNKSVGNLFLSQKEEN